MLTPLFMLLIYLSMSAFELHVKDKDRSPFLDIKLDANSVFETMLPEEDNVLIYTIEGSTLVGENDTQVMTRSAATLNFDSGKAWLPDHFVILHLMTFLPRPL